MIEIKHHPISIMVGFAIALHMLWALLIALDPSALNATGLNALRIHNTPPLVVAASIFVAAVCATIGILTRRPWMVFLLLPQQIMLMMSAAGAIEAMWLAQFADGVIRPRAFIIADQSYAVFAAIGHTIAIIAHALRVVR